MRSTEVQVTFVGAERLAKATLHLSTKVYCVNDYLLTLINLAVCGEVWQTVFLCKAPER